MSLFLGVDRAIISDLSEPAELDVRGSGARGGVSGAPAKIGIWLLVLNVALVGALGLWRALGSEGQEPVWTLEGLVNSILGLSLALMTWRAADAGGLAPSERLGWRLVASAWLASWAGSLLGLTREALLGATSFPSVADLGYLAFVSLMLAGLLRLVRPFEDRAERIQLWLDVCLVVTGAGIVIWYMALRDLATAVHSGFLQIAFSVSYPVGGLFLMVGMAALLLRRRPGRPSAPIPWLVAGLALHVLADARFGIRALHGVAVSGQATDALYTLSYILSMVAAFKERRLGDGPPQLRSGARHVESFSGIGLLPYLSTLAGYLVLAAAWLGPVEARWEWDLSLWVLIGAAAVSTALTLVRQTVLSREIARLRSSDGGGAAEVRLAALVRHSTDLIGVLGADLRLKFLSPAAESVLGTSTDSLADRPMLDLMHPDDRHRASVFLQRIQAREGATAVTEWRLRHADGSWRDIETFATNLLANPSVEGLVLNSRDITERKRMEERLRQLAFKDPLTGLANRTLFRDRLEHALARAEREDTKVTLLYLDLDDFKRVNDSLGHAAGDALLKTLSERLQSCARPSDTVARLGGDELALLVEDPLTPESAAALAERVAERVAEPVDLGGRTLSVSASIGIAQGGAADGVDALIGNADIAMYSVKNRGKRGQAWFDPRMQASATERMDLELDLQRAVDAGELELHYQPIVHLPTERQVGVEALVRWRHPHRGLLLPDAFIPVAEDRVEPMLALGRWVLHRACVQAKRWQDRRPVGAPWRLAANISVRQLQHGDLVMDVEEALAASGLGPECLILELTESALTHGTDETVRQLAALRSRGVRLAIDNFGMGYSSLVHLQRFPIDILKIDPAFVASLADASGDRRPMKAILAVGASLGLETIAAGVERECQAETLMRLGCRFGQGYRFGRPMDPETLTAEWTEAAIA